MVEIRETTGGIRRDRPGRGARFARSGPVRRPPAPPDGARDIYFPRGSDAELPEIRYAMTLDQATKYAPGMALGFVRPARPDDAEEIARIQLSTWRTAYRRMFPAHVL